MVAPGTNILSTALRGFFRRLSGTSMAAAFVAGAAAILKRLHPPAGSREIAGLLEASLYAFIPLLRNMDSLFFILCLYREKAAGRLIPEKRPGPFFPGAGCPLADRRLRKKGRGVCSLRRLYFFCPCMASIKDCRTWSKAAASSGFMDWRKAPRVLFKKSMTACGSMAAAIWTRAPGSMFWNS
ncbi:MAG: S8 family serine peptidase [Armatimonadetes bacterium]|nr:S8 family serine peptidase [Armatimonadota bacterium]